MRGRIVKMTMESPPAAQGKGQSRGVLQTVTGTSRRRPVITATTLVLPKRRPVTVVSGPVVGSTLAIEGSSDAQATAARSPGCLRGSTHAACGLA